MDDLARLETIWDWARDQTGAAIWLAGDYSAADAFFAPVASRIATYNLPVYPPGPWPMCRRIWRTRPSGAGGRWAWWMVPIRSSTAAPTPAGPGPARCRWPPARSKAPSRRTPLAPIRAIPVTHVLEMDGKRWGFCNAFCRDKTVADPEAWPAFMAMLRG
jgi:glutathione S-transferase